MVDSTRSQELASGAHEQHASRDHASLQGWGGGACPAGSLLVHSRAGSKALGPLPVLHTPECGGLQVLRHLDLGKGQGGSSRSGKFLPIRDDLRLAQLQHDFQLHTGRQLAQHLGVDLSRLQD